MAITARMHTEGRQWAFEVLFSQQQSVPTNFYVGLCSDTVIAENASLSALSELSVGGGDLGYARQPLVSNAVDWTSAATGTMDRKVTSSQIIFAPTTSGTIWTKAEAWFLATTIDDSGELIASGPLNSGSGWTLSEGQTLEFEIQKVWPST